MVRVSVGNLLVVTALAIAGIYGFKAAMRIFPVRGLSDVAAGI
jgi:hypothetical protein